MNGSSAYSNSQLREDFKKEHAAALQAKMLPYRTTGPDVDIVVYFTDEISMVSADLFGRAELQERQVKGAKKNLMVGYQKLSEATTMGRARQDGIGDCCVRRMFYSIVKTRLALGQGRHTGRQAGRSTHAQMRSLIS